MNIQEARKYCLSKPHTSECMPFDDMTLVFKVGGKMFALLSLEEDHAINLKCEPERAMELRERYPSISAGYHMNKTHWNTIALDAFADNELLMQLIDHSWELIVNSLPKKQQALILGEKTT